MLVLFSICSAYSRHQWARPTGACSALRSGQTLVLNSNTQYTPQKIQEILCGKSLHRHFQALKDLIFSDTDSDSNSDTDTDLDL